MNQYKPVSRTRPANEVLKDLEQRLYQEDKIPNSSYTRTLELTGFRAPTEEQAIDSSLRLLQPKSFYEAATLYLSVVSSKEITEEKKRESDEKSRTREISEKEVQWRQLMTSELERKEKLLQTLESHLMLKTKKLSNEMSDELKAEILSQARVLAAYEKKGQERNKTLSETLNKQITQLKELGTSPVTEYLGNDRKTWVIKPSELTIYKEKEFEHFA